MNCFICFNIINCKQKITLECNHYLCRKCSLKWFINHSTCPFCRKITYYYNRSLRSTNINYNLRNECITKLTECIINQNINECFTILNEYILHKKYIWYNFKARHFLNYLLIEFLEYINRMNENVYKDNEKLIIKLISFIKID